MDTHQPGPESRPSSVRELHWSTAEKKIARQAFDRALQREFEAVIQETKRLAAAIQQPDDLWRLEDYLRQQRKQIDFRYEFRYSRLLFVFAAFLEAGRVSEQDLQGLDEQKLAEIRCLASR